VSTRGFDVLRKAARKVGVPWLLRCVKDSLNACMRSAWAFACVVLLSVCQGSGVDSESLPTGSLLQETNSGPATAELLQIEEQLRSYRQTVEETGKEAREAAARGAEVLSNGLKTLETAFSSHQEALSAHTARELQVMQSSNRVSLFVAGTLAAMAAVAMLLIAYFQWRMNRAWAGVSALVPALRKIPCGSVVAEFAPGDPNGVPTDPVEDSTHRLLGAVKQLEKRIEGLEQDLRPALEPNGKAPSAGNGNLPTGSNGGSGSNSSSSLTNENSRIPALLAQIQSMLKENEFEAAIRCFDEVLSLNPNHSEALVKKGAVLERLQRLNEAFNCYDRAIAADASLTIAYLHKGGLCNRLERFKEALECYEKALQTRDEWRG
jgi:tetratricopeptide (TPR) repeat protein